MEEDISLITPYALENPLAPLLAAEMEGVLIEPSLIRKRFETLLQKYDAVIVEGVGGLLVPIAKDYFVLDMAKDFSLPLLVVSRPSLGTINHTLLTVEKALLKGLSVGGVVLNYSGPAGGTLAERTNPEILERLLPVPLIGVFPYLKNRLIPEIEKAVSKSLDLSFLEKSLFD